MDNEGFSGPLAPPGGAQSVNRGGSYTQRKISEDYNANQYPEGRRISSWSRKTNFGEEDEEEGELPELVPEEPGAKKWSEKSKGRRKNWRVWLAGGKGRSRK